MKAGTATQKEIAAESVSDMDLTGLANELGYLDELIKQKPCLGFNEAAGLEYPF